VRDSSPEALASVGTELVATSEAPEELEAEEAGAEAYGESSKYDQLTGRRTRMGLLAERAADRMQARQTYRTMARMQRRRSFVEDNLGMREDFSSRREPAQAAEPAPAPATSDPEYVGELERLAQLRDQGILTDDEFEAKKKQILGI
jgi:hypothetical protein